MFYEADMTKPEKMIKFVVIGNVDALFSSLGRASSQY